MLVHIHHTIIALKRHIFLVLAFDMLSLYSFQLHVRLDLLRNHCSYLYVCLVHCPTTFLGNMIAQSKIGQTNVIVYLV